MTWEDLENIISEMTTQQKQQPVVFAEPYDEGALFPCIVVKALEDFGEDMDHPILKKDNYFLSCGE